MRVLIGDGDATDLGAVYAAPCASWLRLNFVSTVDGAVQGEDGVSGSINNAADKAVFDTLRELADAIVIGAGTAQIEGYRPTDKPTVVVTGSGSVPPTLLGGEPGSLLVVTRSGAPNLAAARQQVGDDRVLVLGDEAVDVARLRPALAERGLDHLLCEGGPTLARSLLAAEVVDELCATVVPRLIAGDHLRLAAGPGIDVRLRLTGLLYDDESATLLARWRPIR